MNLLLLFWFLLKASLFSTGGLGNMPSLHNDLLPRGWATEKDFGESLAVGQVSPGPNGLWVVSLGYFVAGWRGALLALVAICIPPMSILVIERIYRRVKNHPAIEGFVQGLSLSVVGVFAVVLMQLLASVGITAESFVILAASVGLGMTRRVPIIVIIAAAGLAGFLWR